MALSPLPFAAGCRLAALAVEAAMKRPSAVPANAREWYFIESVS
jgi:hypothetical protein